MAIRSIDKERLKHINFVMDDLHSSLNQVYEHLVDREFPELKKEKPAKDYGAEIKKDLFKILSKYGKRKK